jgi:cell division protein FtsI (penicillin-binding protein 3)
MALCVILFAAVSIRLGWRLAFLHLGPHDGEREQLERRMEVTRTLRAPRGRIMGRGGEGAILALDRTVYNVCVDPDLVLTNDHLLVMSDLLAETFDVPADALAVELNRPGVRYHVVKRRVDPAVVECLRAAAVTNRLRELIFEDQLLRHYPHGTFLAHVVGFSNRDSLGLAGIEQRHDKQLKGHPGEIRTKVDARRREIVTERAYQKAAVAGSDVELTVDFNIQHVVEQALSGVVEKYDALGGAIIVQDVTTGEILGMASRPGYDLNTYWEADTLMIRNRALSAVYEPGSTFKAVVFSAALAEGLVTPDTMFDCEGGAWFYARRILRDAHGYGMLSVADGLKKSSNIMAAKLALMLGDRRFHNYITSFGIGSRSGIDLPGEERGILKPAAKWPKIKATRVAIGQGVAVTPLQIVNLYSAIANGGSLMRPYIVRRVVSPTGELLHEGKPHVVRQVLPASTARLMCGLLQRVTEPGGTGRRARIPGYSVAGKTGTAQKPVRGGYSETDYIASFVGFVPAQSPRIAVVVMVDRPRPDYYGGVVAGPVFKEVASKVVRYLNVAPDLGEWEDTER